MTRDNSPIFLIGFMAAGKTTFGRALARATDRQFIDLDFYIGQRFRKPVSKIFEDEGEQRFRDLEKAMLRETGCFENTVIACGGGTPCFFDNMDFMLNSGTVVFLDASTERIVERIIANNAARPLMAGKSPAEIRDAVSLGLEQRLPFYDRAHIRFNGDNLEDRRQIDSSVAEFLSAFPSLG